MSCSAVCAHIADAGCAQPTQDECISNCQQAAQACPSEAAAAGSCFESAPVTCDGNGVATVGGCSSEQDALSQCGSGGGSGSGSVGSSSGVSSGGSGGSGSSSGSSSGGGAIPAGGACSEGGDPCEPITCTCRDGAVYGPISLCFNSICQGTSDGCSELCSSDGGY